jgi:adenylate kinase
MIFIFFGPPGSGKGTQAKYLVDNYDFAHISTGDLLRHEIENQTVLGSEVKAIMESGVYVPDKTVIDLIENVLSNSRNNNFIFDGYPRTLNQALAFDALLSVKKLKVDLVFNFEVDKDLLIKRISGRFSCVSCGAVYNDTFMKTVVEGICDKCGSHEFFRRKDDNPEVFKKRIEVYLKEIKMVRDFYRNKNLVKDIDASQAAELIQIEVKNSLIQSGFII